MELNEKDITHLENIVDYCNDISSAIDELSIEYNSFRSSKIQKSSPGFLC